MAIVSTFPEKKGLNTDDINDIASGEISNGFVQSQTCYSTEEQVVGKWIDGKPLYQKTYSLMTPSTSGSVVIGNEPNIATIEIKELIATVDGIHGTGSSHVTYNADRPYSGQETPLWIRANGEIAMQANYAGSQNRPVYITIRYTKTTD